MFSTCCDMLLTTCHGCNSLIISASDGMMRHVYIFFKKNKKMKFKIVRQNNQHLESSGKYYAKIVQNDVIDTERLTRELSGRTGFSEGTVHAVLRDFATILRLHLQNGDVVDIDHIGRFKLKVESEAMNSPEEFNPRKHIKGYKCLFSPATDGNGNKPLYPEI